MRFFPEKYKELINSSNVLFSGEIKKSGIKKAPGSRLDKFTKFVFSKKTYEQIYQPTIYDMQEEYFDALATGQLLKARIVRARGYFSFFSAMALHLPVSSIKVIRKIWTIVG